MKSCRALGTRADVFRCDLAADTAPSELVRQVTEGLGPLEILINNASLFEPMQLETFDLAAWDRMLRVNLTVPMALCAAAAPGLRACKGRVVNLCDAAVGRPLTDYVSYMVSKGGLETLTRVLARALAPDVNVVGIAPGVAAWPDDLDEAARERLTWRIPLRRAGTPEEIAAAVHFALAQGDFLTGAIVPIDGGRHLA